MFNAWISKTQQYLYFIHRAVALDDPFQRIKAVVKFYLSGFYKKPKVNSILILFITAKLF